MPKRLVVCCDGTWNRPDQTSHGVAAPTNVSKLALAVAREDAAGTSQLLHYEPGVGTRRFERLRGGAFGFGLSRNVRDCYRFLVLNYEPGDELFFLGFSRGAFTARSTVGLVRNAGILRDRRVDLVKRAYQLYRARSDETKPRGREAQLFRRMYSHPDARIRFVGVWDTVGSLGIPIHLPFLTRRWSFHDTDLSTYVDNAFQALAIDERRRAFRPTLWNQQPDAGDQRLEQVWFAGVHCDVGGGYEDPALAELALAWMIDRARECGLGLEPDGAPFTPEPLADMGESYKGLYRLLGSCARMLEPDGGCRADGGAVAPSAALRRRERPDYRPPGLDDCIAETG
ncbi:MAG TPA: DUF2235 domain-containing protein [Thermoleophilaceae bacterium]